jgi:hypothetical protein
MNVSAVGLDLVKNVFQVHGVDAAARVAFNRQLRSAQLAAINSQPLQTKKWRVRWNKGNHSSSLPAMPKYIEGDRALAVPWAPGGQLIQPTGVVNSSRVTLFGAVAPI